MKTITIGTTKRLTGHRESPNQPEKKHYEPGHLWNRQLKTLVPEAGISSRDKLLHPTEYCGMQLFTSAWYTCFWRQSHEKVMNDIIYRRTFKPKGTCTWYEKVKL